MKVPKKAVTLLPNVQGSLLLSVEMSDRMATDMCKRRALH